MKNRTSFITNETVKMHTSFAKTFFIIAGAALLFSLTVYVYYNFIRTESLRFYKDIDNCSVSLRTETHRTRSGKRSKTRTSYYVYVTTPEGEQDLKMNVSRSYYDAMSLYNGKKDITLSFFKTKSGALFPSTIAGCSEKEAGRQYVKCYPPNMLNISYAHYCVHRRSVYRCRPSGDAHSEELLGRSCCTQAGRQHSFRGTQRRVHEGIQRGYAKRSVQAYPKPVQRAGKRGIREGRKDIVAGA